MPLSNEEDRRFKDIIQGLTDVADPEEQHAAHNFKTNFLLFVIFTVGLILIIVSVIIKTVIVGVAGFAVILFAAYRLMSNVFSRNDKFEE